MGIVFVYSFLIAFVLPGPSEVVLTAPLDLGLPLWARLGTIMLVSAVGLLGGVVTVFRDDRPDRPASGIARLRRSSSGACSRLSSPPRRSGSRQRQHDGRLRAG
jgi:hypothetical protein